MPPTPPPHYGAADLYYEYGANETRANSLYTGKTLTITLTGITRIADNGRVLKRMGSMGGLIQVDFKDDREIIHLNPGDSVTAICQVDGAPEYTMGQSLSFSGCKIVGWETPDRDAGG